MGIFDFIKESIFTNIINSRKTQGRSLYKEDFLVAGINYHMDAVYKLAVSNKDYRSSKKVLLSNFLNKKVFQYSFVNKPIKLVPEPTNPHDSNAIMVIIAGEFVGYISMNDNVHVKHILKKCDIKYISSFISGGKYKLATSDGTVIHDEVPIKINVRIAYAK